MSELTDIPKFIGIFFDKYNNGKIGIQLKKEHYNNVVCVETNKGKPILKLSEYVTRSPYPCFYVSCHYVKDQHFITRLIREYSIEDKEMFLFMIDTIKTALVKLGLATDVKINPKIFTARLDFNRYSNGYVVKDIECFSIIDNNSTTIIYQNFNFSIFEDKVYLIRTFHFNYLMQEYVFDVFSHFVDREQSFNTIKQNIYSNFRQKMIEHISQIMKIPKEEFADFSDEHLADSYKLCNMYSY